jgi:hypothetical protein
MQAMRFDGSATAYDMVLQSAGGKVGIGTLGPAAKLEVSIAAATSGEIARFTSPSYDSVYVAAGSSATSCGIGTFSSSSFNLFVNSSSKVIVTNAGNVGIGTTSPTAKLSVDGNIETVAATYRYLKSSGWISNQVGQDSDFGVNDVGIIAKTGTNLCFVTAASERARIDSSGNLLVGTTTAQTGVASDAVGITLYGSTSLGTGVFTRNGIPLYVNNKNASGALIQFYCNGNNIGTISSDGTNTAYNTSSDYRLKNTIAPMTGALAKVALLKPVTYKWNADGSDGEGFIAHELAEVVPQCVTGEKDAVDEEGNPKYQGIDTSFLVATLTAALQEAVAKINSLEARLDAANL